MAINLKLEINNFLTNQIGTKNRETRENWLKKTLLSLPKNQKILDAGAGECQYKKFCTHLNYYSQDIAIYDGIGDNSGIQKGKRNYNTIDIVSDIVNIPVEDESFDSIMCIEVLEHIVDPNKALSELTRILKKGGKLILTAPFASLTHYAPYHYSTGFNKYYYEFHLSKLGYKVLEITPNGNYFQYLAQEVRYSEVAAEQYSNFKSNFLDKVTKLLFLRYLNKINKVQDKSDELLNFGYMIVAEKNN